MVDVNTTKIEGFVIDQGFIDRTKYINGILTDEAGKVGALTPKALSYFVQPSLYNDTRDPSSRIVNWSAETNPSMVVDGVNYSGFVSAINNAPTTIAVGLFKLIDKLLFNYSDTSTHSEIEAELIADADISEIYIPDSFEISSSIVSDSIYYNSGTQTIVDVPEFIKFSINIVSGTETIPYVITLFTSVEAWLTGYDISTITKIIPPLPYSQLYSASLSNSTDNIFSTASLSAALSYNTTYAVIGTISVSGITEYNAVLVDTEDNSVAVPFNILYKGRSPTLSEIRTALKNELLNSGVGDAAGWEARIPGVFVAGRFYIVPFWDITYTKPDQILFPSIVTYSTLGTKMNKILESTGFGDITGYADIFPIYYNRMTVAAVPDLTGVVDIHQLSDIIPDYQSFSPDDENFVYMTELSQGFAKELSTIITLDSTNGTSDIYTPITENILTFYSFVVGQYEVCVITKNNYIEIMENTQ